MGVSAFHKYGSTIPSHLAFNSASLRRRMRRIEAAPFHAHQDDT